MGVKVIGAGVHINGSRGFYSNGPGYNPPGFNPLFGKLSKLGATGAFGVEAYAWF